MTLGRCSSSSQSLRQLPRDTSSIAAGRPRTCLQSHRSQTSPQASATEASADELTVTVRTTSTTQRGRHLAAPETVSFAHAGRAYEIDLGEKNRSKLEKALQPFISAAAAVSRGLRRHRLSGGRPRGPLLTRPCAPPCACDAGGRAAEVGGAGECQAPATRAADGRAR
jgi:hypothetical protein